MSTLMSPRLWESISYKDPDSFHDFLFRHDGWHRELAKLTQTRYWATDDLKQNLLNHAQMHINVAQALAIPQIGDLLSFDLADPESFLNFMFLNATDHERFRLVTGL